MAGGITQSDAQADTAVGRRMRRVERETPLFGALPPNLMHAFSSSYRVVNEDILTALVDDLFREGLGAVTYPRVLDAIRAVVDERHPDLEIKEEEGKQANDKSYALYRSLHNAGWFVEAGYGASKTVDLNPNARILLNSLLDIKRGLTRSWGGEVLTVLTLIETAASAPAERAEAVRSACRASRNFQHHLRTLTSHLADIEREILARMDIGSVVGGFFEIFVGRYLIEDYARLKSRTNPFRFRDNIVDKAMALRENPEVMDVLAEAYHAEGRARGRSHGFETVHQELSEVILVFSNIDNAVEAVEEASQRLERKFMNMIRHRERYDEAALDSAIDLMRSLLASSLGLDALVPVPADLLQDAPVHAPDREMARRARRAARGQDIVEIQPQDPAFSAYCMAMLAYQNMLRVSEATALAYLDRVVGGRFGEIPLSAFPVTCLEDALVVSQLRGLFVLGGGRLGDRYAFVGEGIAVDNEWFVLEGMSVVDETAVREVA